MKSDLHEKYNMNMAAISILYAVISDLEKRVTVLQTESNEIMEKISNEGIRERVKDCQHTKKCVYLEHVGYCHENCKGYLPRQSLKRT